MNAILNKNTANAKNCTVYKYKSSYMYHYFHVVIVRN